MFPRLVRMVACALGVWPIVGSAQLVETRWTGAAGNGLWTDAGNWSNGLPTNNDRAIYDTTSGVIDLGGGTAASLDLMLQVPDLRFTNGTLATKRLWYEAGSGSWTGPSVEASLTSSGQALWMGGNYGLATATNMINVRGPIVGSGFSVQLAGSARLTGESTYSGPTYVLPGPGINFLTDAGRLSGTSSLGVYGGNLILDNRDNNQPDRLPDSAVLALSRGEFHAWPNSVPGGSERVGGIHLLPGGGDISFGAGGGFVLSAPTLTREKHALALIDQTHGKVVLDTPPVHTGGGPGAGTTAKGILPYLGQWLYDTGPNPTDPSDDLGFRPLDSTELETSLPPAGAIGPAPNVRVTTAQSISGLVRVNSLSSTTTTTLNNAELHIEGGYLEPGVITGTGTIQAPGELIVNGSRATQLNNSITAESLTLYGNGDVYMNVPNTVPGGVFSQAAALHVNTAAALGTGPLTLARGYLHLGPGMVVPNDILFGTPAIPREEQVVTSYDQFFIQSSYKQPVTLSGNLTGDAVSLTTGTGASLRINGNASFKALQMNSFTFVEINGTVSGANPGAYSEASVYATDLYGNGSLIGIFSSGNISPGVAGAPGRLTIQFMGNATYIAELNGLDAGLTYDQLVLLKPVPDSALDGFKTLHLQVDLGFAPSLGDTFTIMDNQFDGPSCRFSGLNEGAIFSANGTQFQISYTSGDGNDVILRVVPEPTLLAPVGTGAVLVLRRARRRFAAPGR